MMRYLPHTSEDIDEMLRTSGLQRLEDLFALIPRGCLRDQDLGLPTPQTEWELKEHVQELSEDTANSQGVTNYLGAGSYDHYIPSSCKYLISRSELSTAYTPYQPEVSQGTLQAIFEYQTMISNLFDMDVSNASMYDGASAFAEAVFMALRIARKKNTVAVSRLIHPAYRQVLQTYLDPTDFKLIELPYLDNGRTDISSVASLDDLAAVAVQSPNFFGCIEDLQDIFCLAKEHKALGITCFTEPLAYALYKSPGAQGADIVCGEGQSLGIPQSFGGPGLGILCTCYEHVRRMPGRIVGQTQDQDGQVGYVLTLATREQHIRREKATSNICSNQGLCATMAAMYLASTGAQGLKALAALNRDKTEYLKRELRKNGCVLPFSAPSFNEFVVKFPEDLSTLRTRLEEKNILAGLPLSSLYPELADHALMCVTETKSKEVLDLLVKEVSQ
jgi:glycine dehydrogenase subunit 1